MAGKPHVTLFEGLGMGQHRLDSINARRRPRHQMVVNRKAGLADDPHRWQIGDFIEVRPHRTADGGVDGQNGLVHPLLPVEPHHLCGGAPGNQVEPGVEKLHGRLVAEGPGRTQVCGPEMIHGRPFFFAFRPCSVSRICEDIGGQPWMKTPRSLSFWVQFPSSTVPSGTPSRYFPIPTWNLWSDRR